MSDLKNWKLRNATKFVEICYSSSKRLVHVLILQLSVWGIDTYFQVPKEKLLCDAHIPPSRGSLTLNSAEANALNSCHSEGFPVTPIVRRGADDTGRGHAKPHT